MEDRVENSLLGIEQEQILQQETKSVEMNSARILQCVEQNRTQKFQLMELLQQKVKIILAASPVRKILIACLL
jgi:hypothetical protein